MSRLRAHRGVFLAIAIVLLLPLLLVAGAVLVAQTDWAERWIETRLAEGSQREVHIEALDFELARAAT